MCLTDETGQEFDYAKSPGRCKRHAARHSERRTGFLGPPLHGARAAGAFSTCYPAAVITPLGERRPLVDASAWVADSAVVVGDVVIGGSAITA